MLALGRCKILIIFEIIFDLIVIVSCYVGAVIMSALIIAAIIGVKGFTGIHMVSDSILGICIAILLLICGTIVLLSSCGIEPNEIIPSISDHYFA